MWLTLTLSAVLCLAYGQQFHLPAILLLALHLVRHYNKNSLRNGISCAASL